MPGILSGSCVVFGVPVTPSRPGDEPGQIWSEQMDEKTWKPVAVCTVCGQHTYRAEAINQQCSNRYGKHYADRPKRCKGVFESALRPDDWEKCPACAASGRKDGTRCSHCQGSGWIFVRKG